MPSGNLFTEEGRTRFRNFGLRLWSYLLVFSTLGAIAGAFVFAHWTRGGMGPLERLYFRQYMKATAASSILPNRPGNYVLLVSERDGTSPGAGISRPRWRRARVRNSEMERWFRHSIYGGAGL